MQLPWLMFATKIEVMYTDALLQNYFLTSYQGLKGEFKNVPKEEFIMVLSNRVNHGKLLIDFNHHIATRKANLQPIFYNSDDYINHFCVPTKLFS